MWLKAGLNGIPLNTDELKEIETLCIRHNTVQKKDCLPTDNLKDSITIISDKLATDETKKDANTYWGLREEQTFQTCESDDNKKVSVYMVKDYIETKLNDAKNEGLCSIRIKSGDIHKELGLSSRMPTVCNAMYKLQTSGDIIIERPPKGYGSRLIIEYHTGE